jgi:hypothetical protein
VELDVVGMSLTPGKKGLPRVALSTFKRPVNGNGVEPLGESDIALGDLADVVITSPTNAQVLSFNATTNRWVNAVLIIPPEPLDWLTDVIVTAPTNGQGLVYSSSAGKWVNGAVATTLSALGDCTITAPAIGQVLTWNGTKWVNSAATGGGGGSSTLAGLLDVSLTTPANNDVLTYESATSLWKNKPATGGGGSTPLSAYYFAVETYGAVGDGVTDDVTAIEAACAAAQAANGGVVLFKTKTYQISRAINMASYPDVSLLGANGGSHYTRIRSSGTVLAVSSATNFAASGIRFECTTANNLVIIHTGVFAYFENCFFTEPAGGSGMGCIVVDVDAGGLVLRNCQINGAAGILAIYQQHTVSGVAACKILLRDTDINNCSAGFYGLGSDNGNSVVFDVQGGTWNLVTDNTVVPLSFGNTYGYTQVRLQQLNLNCNSTQHAILDGGFAGNELVCEGCHILNAGTGRAVYATLALVSGSGNSFGSASTSGFPTYATNGAHGQGFRADLSPSGFWPSYPAVPASTGQVRNNTCKAATVYVHNFAGLTVLVDGIQLSGGADFDTCTVLVPPGSYIQVNYTTVGAWAWAYA